MHNFFILCYDRNVHHFCYLKPAHGQLEGHLNHIHNSKNPCTHD